MPRSLALLVLLLAVASVRADRIPGPPPPRPVIATITAEVVATGTVTEIESDTVKAKTHPDAKDEIEYKVLVVKIDAPLVGVKKGTTHLKVGVPLSQFEQPGQPLQKDGQFLLYLTKHSTTNLLLSSHTPLNLAARGADDQLRRVKVAAAAITDPVAALKAKDKDDRVLAACALAMYYRKTPPNGSGTEAVARPEEESKLLLQALAEGEWSTTAPAEAGNPYMVLLGLGLEQEKDGFQMPKSVGEPNVAAAAKEAFVKWLDGKGKDARVKQLVPKK